ncbi:hypothetical protein ABVK25_007383 [Lepraria finkii]|uniref:Uncharacterized protein n=1 Tax=Lepraria finkii TaxID=1340010 RepID=A0ABR4B2Z1_9LECA
MRASVCLFHLHFHPQDGDVYDRIIAKTTAFCTTTLVTDWISPAPLGVSIGVAGVSIGVAGITHCDPLSHLHSSLPYHLSDWHPKFARGSLSHGQCFATLEDMGIFYVIELSIHPRHGQFAGR